MKVLDQRVPLKDFRDEQIFARVLSGDKPSLSLEVATRHGLGEDFIDFIHICWEHDPNIRPKMLLVEKKIKEMNETRLNPGACYLELIPRAFLLTSD